MADNVEITLKPTVVKPDDVPSIDYDELYNNLSADQKAIANKIFDEAERQGVNPDLMLSIAHIENRFNTGASPKGALGPMQLMPGTAKDLGVDPNNIDQNIAGGITYYKQMLDKYKDPYVAGIAYNAGPGVADNFLKTDDLNDLPLETKNYIDQLDKLYKPKGVDIDVNDVPIIGELPKDKATFKRDAMTEAAGAGLGAAAGVASGAYTDAKIKQAEAGERAAQRQTTSAEKRIAAGETRVAAKEGEHAGRLKIQTTAAESSTKEASRLRDAQLTAEKRLAKATDNARRYGVLEEVVKTTPGGVTQQGGLGSGAMRHANTMGEVHEANVVRKGTEATGSGWQQKSRLIVPDKYAGASVYSPEQLAAQKEFAAAEAEHQRLIKAADKAESVAQKEADRLRNLTEKGPAGKTAAQVNLDMAKQDYAKAVANKAPGVGTNAVRYLSKIPGMSAIPAATAGLDIAEARERFNQGDYTGAAISGIGGAGGALSMIPPIGPVGAGLKLIGGLTSMVAPMVNYYRDSTTEPAPAEQKPGYAAGGKVAAILAEKAKKFHPTVRGRERVAFPKVYRDPRIIVNESAGRVSEESPLLKQLFGVDRYDLDAMTREMPHNLAAPYYVATRPPEYLPGLKGKANTQRIQDILSIAENDPRFAGSYGWYQSEPLRQRFIELNPEGARDFDRFSQLGAALSPSTAVPKEIERSSVAYLMDKQGRLSDFLDPRNMPKGYGHAYHTTAHNAGVRNILERGDFRPEQLKMAPKTRVYYGSRTGENLDVPTADAHFVRGIGLADLRPATKADDFGSSISATELDPITQWYRGDVASPVGMRASPAQALQWNAMGTSTGVDTELGVPFLELLSRRIGDVAASERVRPSIVRDEFIRGERHLAKGGVVQGYDDGGKVDLANSSKYIDGSSRENNPYARENNPYGYVLDDSNSRMDVSPRASLDSAVISDGGNLVHNAVSRNAAFADKYLGSAGRLASKGLSSARQFLNDEVPTYTRQGNRFGDWVIGEMPEAIYDYTTAGMPGPVLGNEWVHNPVTGGMMHTDPYGDIRALSLLNLLGAEIPFVKAGKAAYKAASPLLRKVMNPPVAVMEATSPGLLQNTYRMRNTGELANDPAGLALTDERAQEALGTSGLDKYNVTTGQGAWGGDSGSEFNRAYAVTLPRLGPLSKYDSQLAQFGSDTDQMMMSSIRFTPQKGSSASTAIKVNNVSEQDIINLNKKLGDNFVVQHRPKDKSAVIYNWTNKPKQMGALEDTIYSVVPNKKLTFGTYESSVIGDEGKYSKFNVKPKTPKLIDIEKRAAQRENKRKK